MRSKFFLWVAIILSAFLTTTAEAQAPQQSQRLPAAGQTPQPAPPSQAKGDSASSPTASAAPQKPPLLDRAAVLKEAGEVTLAKYPDADDVLVDDRISVRYEADGTSVTFDETWQKVLTEKGRRDDQSLPLEFNAAYGDVSVDVLEVVKPDGTAVPVDVAGQSRVMTQSGQMGANIYDPNQKVLQIGIPDLVVGDTVHYRAIHRTTKAVVPNTWSDYTELESTSPIRHFSYEVSGPKERPLRSIAVKDEVAGTVSSSKSEEGDRILYRWVVRNVPRMYEEPNMPPAYTCVQRLLVSTIGGWPEISRWYWQLCLPHLQPTDAMKATVIALTPDIADPTASAADKRQKKIEALFKFVSQKIRYLGLTVETEAPGYEPHDVRITFENKYGVCRDKAALLVEMLRLADIEAFPVLIQVGPKKDADVPQPYFNHAIVAARNTDGSWQLMDPTDENTRELLPAYLSNDSYLVATPEGETLKTSPITPATQNLMRINTVASLSADGNLFAETELHFDGFNDNAYRDYFSRVQAEERRAFFEGLLRRVVAGARLGDFEVKPADLMDTSVPLTVRLKFEAPSVAVTGDGLVLLPLLRFGTRVGMVNFLLGNTGLEKRKYPLVTDVACGVRETLSLNAQSLGATVSLPKNESLDTEALGFAVSVARQENTLRRDESFTMKVVEFTPAQYLTLKDALKTMESYERQWAMFAAPEVSADATVLSETVSYELSDPHTWTETRAVRLKVLTYAGTKEQSEIKLDYNPVWEEVTLESATVTNPDGAVHSVAKSEQNLMDAAWVGDAPRYPAAKTLVVSLPGIEVGSVIEYKVKRTCKDRPFFARRESFRGYDPIQAKSLTVLWNAETVRQEPRTETRLPGELKQATVTIGTRPYACEVWTAANQPAVKRERQLPPAWAYVPTVCLSCGDWKAYSAEVGRALETAASDQKEARRMAKALIQGARNDEARLLAVRDYVVLKVRAAGPGLNELPLSAITPADRTLADGYGNSADRAALLHAMLRAAGFKPDFVLASGAPVVPNLVHPMTTCPSLSDFDSVLVRVQLDDKDVYLNDTDQYAALGSTPHDADHGLDLRDGSLCIIRALPDKADRSETTYGIQLKANGDAQIRKCTRYFGMGYAEKRKHFAEMVPEERRRYLQEAVAQIAQAAVAEGDLRTEFEGRYPGVEEFTVRIPGYAVRDGKYLYLALPAALQDLFAFQSETRANPLYWPNPRRVTLRTELSVPTEFRTLLLQPQPMEWDAPQNSGWIKLKTFDGVRDTQMEAPGTEPSAPADKASFCFEWSAQLRPAFIPAGDYDELLLAQRLLSHPGARAIVLTEK